MSKTEITSNQPPLPPVKGRWISELPLPCEIWYFVARAFGGNAEKCRFGHCYASEALARKYANGGVAMPAVLVNETNRLQWPDFLVVTE